MASRFQCNGCEGSFCVGHRLGGALIPFTRRHDVLHQVLVEKLLRVADRAIGTKLDIAGTATQPAVTLERARRLVDNRCSRFFIVVGSLGNLDPRVVGHEHPPT